MDKKIVRHIIKKIWMLTALIAAMYLTDAVLNNGLTLSKCYPFGDMNDIIKGKVNADILVMGSSRAFVDFDCQKIEGYLKNETCFNMGLDGTTPWLQMGVLKAYLKHNSAPKILILSLDIISLGAVREGIFYPERFRPYLNEDDLYGCLISGYPSFRLQKYVPLYEFSIPNVVESLWGYLEHFGFKRSNGMRTVKGYNAVDKQWGDEFTAFKEQTSSKVTFSVKKEAQDVLENIIMLAKKNNIDVIMVYPPEYNEMQKITTNRKEIFEIYKKMSERYNVPFWDYSGLDLTYHTKYFYNSQHLNVAGVERFMGSFSNDLKAYLELGQARIGEK